MLHIYPRHLRFGDLLFGLFSVFDGLGVVIQYLLEFFLEFRQGFRSNLGAGKREPFPSGRRGNSNSVSGCISMGFMGLLF